MSKEHLGIRNSSQQQGDPKVPSFSLDETFILESRMEVAERKDQAEGVNINHDKRLVSFKHGHVSLSFRVGAEFGLEFQENPSTGSVSLVRPGTPPQGVALFVPNYANHSVRITVRSGVNLTVGGITIVYPDSSDLPMSNETFNVSAAYPA